MQYVSTVDVLQAAEDLIDEILEGGRKQQRCGSNGCERDGNQMRCVRAQCPVSLAHLHVLIGERLRGVDDLVQVGVLEAKQEA